MNRQTEALRVSEELLADIELTRLNASEVALKANRVARIVGHDDLLEFLTYERNGYPTDGSADKWIGKAGRWSPDDKGKFYPVPIAQIEASSQSSRDALNALRGGGNYSGDMVPIAAREHDQKIGAHSAVLGRWSAICKQVVATIYDLVAEIYHELLFSELQASLFASTQTMVDGELAASSGTALNKIERVSDRLRDGDPESVSQALTTCRRLIDSCADHLFPAQDEPYVIGEQSLKVGQQNILNRLQAYTHVEGAAKGRRDRLRRALSDLYERCSAGTHAEVTVEEARFVFLQTYVVLGEILTLTAKTESVETE